MLIQIRERTTGRLLDVPIAEINRAHALLHAQPMHLTDVASLPLAERMRRVEEAVAAHFPLTYRDGNIDPESYARVIDVFDRELVLRRGSKTYRLQFAFNADLSVTFKGTPREVIVSYEPVDGSDAGDDDEATLAASDAHGADARWMAGIARIKRENPGMNDRQAGEVLSLREPALWHARRSELAGEQLPTIRQRHNRHFINDSE
jgi:hypothetical protein